MKIKINDIKYRNLTRNTRALEDSSREIIFHNLMGSQLGVENLPEIEKLNTSRILNDPNFEALRSTISNESEATAFAAASFLVEEGRSLIQRQRRRYSKTSKTEESKVSKAFEKKASETLEALISVASESSKIEEEAKESGPNAGSESGDIGLIDFQVASLFKDLNFRSLTSLMGRLREVEGLVANSRGLRGMRTQNIDMSDDISRVLSSELVNLADDDCENIFYQDLQNSALQSWEEEGEAPSGDGNLIILLDVSGSMDYIIDYTNPETEAREQTDRLELSKGIVWSILKDREDKSDWLITFDSKVLTTDKVSGNLSDLQKILSLYTAGGTNFEPPLRRAREIAQEFPELGYDILLITDADIPSHEADRLLCDFSKIENSRLFTIAINFEEPPKAIKSISTSYAFINNYHEELLPQLEKLANVILDIEDASNGDLEDAY